MKKPTKRLIATAYHEAAHAVANVRFRLLFYDVTILPNEKLGYLGCVDGQDIYRAVKGRATDVPLEIVDTKRAGQTIVSLLAGYAAQVRYDPRSKKRAARGAESDFQKAAEFIRQRCSQETPWSARWQRRARDFVKQNWKAIKTVARELLETKTLDRDEVEMIVEIANGRKKALEDLAHYRVLGKRPPTRQFPFTVVPPAAKSAPGSRKVA